MSSSGCFWERDLLCAACEVSVSGRTRYNGKGLSLVDDKGRVAIPNALRAALAANSPRADGKGGGDVYLAPHPEFRCLVAYDPAFDDMMFEEVSHREAEAIARDGRMDYAIASRASAGDLLPFDGSGRFIMPREERRYARIENAAYFHASRNVFLIWSPKVLLATENFDPFIKECCELACEDKGIAL